MTSSTCQVCKKPVQLGVEFCDTCLIDIIAAVGRLQKELNKLEQEREEVDDNGKT